MSERQAAAVLRGAVLAANLLLVACSGGSGTAEPDRPVGPTESSAAVDAHGVDLEPVARLSTGLPEAMVFATADGVFVGGASGLVSVDPATARPRWRSEVPAYQVTGGFGSVWVTDFDDSVVRRLDPSSGAVLAIVHVAGNPIGVTAAGGSVWVAAHRRGLVYRIDPATNQVTKSLRIGPDGPSGAMRMAAEGTSVFVDVFSTSTVVQIDARTGSVRTRIAVRGLTACGRLIPDGRSLWVTGCREDDRVARIDLHTGKVIVSDALGAYADGALIASDTLWFSAASDDTAYLIAVDRTTVKVVDRLRLGRAGDSSVAAFGSLWVVAPGEVLKPGELLRFTRSDLVRRRTSAG